MRWSSSSRSPGYWVQIAGASGGGVKSSNCGRRRPAFSALLFAFILVAGLGMIYLGYEVVRLPLENSSGQLFLNDKDVRMSPWVLSRSRKLDSGFFRNEEPLGAVRVSTLVGTRRRSAHPNDVGDDNDVSADSNLSEYYGGRKRFWSLPERRLNLSTSSVSSTFRSTWLGADQENWTHVNLSASECSLAESAISKVDIQMEDVYNDLDISNVDGGVWKQGFPLGYNDTHWNASNILRVFVVPHSHNDPGWLKTFEKYYLDQTQHILNNMVDKLVEDRRRKIIWAETSFLSLWWERNGREKRQALRALIAGGQLEIVTGGWVMSDEALTHYFAMHEQLIEGHEWLQNHIGYYPKNGWAIDPFGMSPTMAYLLKRMGLSHMVIQRVHYSVKKQLARNQSLEFLWRQAWDRENSTDILCHMMPFYSYDVPHSCGPDPKVCCQFDFKRLPGGKVGCPWKVPPQPITPKNVEEKAQLLLDQYRKKSQLFRTNVLLIPLGDDFRFDKPIEWDQQFLNYQRLFDYMNRRSDWHVQAQFGTLEDYFSALAKASPKSSSQIGGSHAGNTGLFPSVVGDFFTYSDRDDHYWSGFYSSRPFYKHMDRALESYLRGAEIIFSAVMARSLATVGAHDSVHTAHFLGRSLASLVDARRNLGLFQHHDAITGTAKDPVVVDYGMKLLQSIQGLQGVLARSASHLLTDTTASGTPPPLVFDLDDTRTSHSSLPLRTPVSMSPDDLGRVITFYNAMGHARIELVILLLDVSRLIDSSTGPCVFDHAGKAVKLQMNPVWHGPDVVEEQLEIAFVVHVPALGFSSYKLAVGVHVNCGDMATILIHPEYDLPDVSNRSSLTNWSIGYSRLGSPFSLRGSHLEATFSDDGLLTSLKSIHGARADNKDINSFATIDVGIEFVTYGTRQGQTKDKSGAYLFLPGSEASPIPVVGHGWYYRVVRGTLVSEVHLLLPGVEHRVRVRSSSGADGFGVEVCNIVNLGGGKKNVEVVMRLVTGVQNMDGHFHTDLNGFQIVRRRNRRDLPLQANFYPVSSMAYIEDKEARFTVATAQSSGVAALQPGWLEFVLDRRLGQDDNRGLQQGVLDNVPTLSQFVFLMERRVATELPPQYQQIPRTAGISLPSLAALRVSHTLLYPIVKLIARLPQDANAAGPSQPLPIYSPVPAPFSLTDTDLPCDVHVVNLRVSTLETEDGRLEPRESTLLVLHRLGFDCSFYMPPLNCGLSDGKLSLSQVFARYFRDEVTQTSLSALYNLKVFSKRHVIEMQPMELYAFRLRFR